MKICLIIDEGNVPILVFTSRADAEEMILAFVEEAQYESFCWSCVDEEEDFDCISELILPWEDNKFVNCNSCENFQCETLKKLLKFFHNYNNFDSWKILELEVIDYGEN